MAGLARFAFALFNTTQTNFHPSSQAELLTSRIELHDRARG
jgi:hypothetical protein